LRLLLAACVAGVEAEVETKSQQTKQMHFFSALRIRCAWAFGRVVLSRNGPFRHD
jgi:hypothetical protein